MIVAILTVACALLALAYVVYGRFIEKRFGVDDSHPTPAQTMTDGVDYVPTADPVLFGHHFSSIAGAGPIVGPIIAGLAFGWLPAILWIVLGSIFVGGVHDFTTLLASIRHRGESIGQICRQYLDRSAYVIFLLFIWFTLVYVLIVFLDLTAGTFAPAAAMTRQGGAVATASVIYIFLAILFGLSVYRFKLRLLTASAVFVPLVFVALWVGTLAPLTADRIPAVLGSAKNTWSIVLLVYCFLASITPVWILLQPRDYLSSFLLYACLLGGAVGLVVAGATGVVSIEYACFTGISDPVLGFIFPALFITIACGAVSGFHSMVASGTTSKQLRAESSARRIGYGGMLVEAVLALVALATIMILAEKPQSLNPVGVFGTGVGRFLSALGLSENLAQTFGLLAVSTFLLTTLDTCTRIARFVVQELFPVLKGATGRILATLVTLTVPAIMVFINIPGPDGAPIPAWKAIWPAFGATNQLLASLALLVIYRWMRHEKRAAAFVFMPMMFMFVTTLTALVQLAFNNLGGRGTAFVGVLSIALGLMALYLLVNTFMSLRRETAVVPVRA